MFIKQSLHIFYPSIGLYINFLQNKQVLHAKNFILKLLLSFTFLYYFLPPQ